ncbi:sialate O-acetylesterase [Sphingobacterium sp. SYP-B4668]|uniref:sialate O-acetylesterase n=1 Tax=Sphingobacterium sp. SYP-B4668 TaxID=2996035 RepID=UPI0022DE6D82|nr:sialate O-acetylesterase [Sphingobacterium sp. SYP-B4668]
MKKDLILLISLMGFLVGSVVAQIDTTRFLIHGDWSMDSNGYLHSQRSPNFSNNLSSYFLDNPPIGNSIWDAISLSFRLEDSLQEENSFGCILNFSDESTYHFLSIGTRDHRTVLKLGKRQYGTIRVVEELEVMAPLVLNRDYQIKIYRAPGVDKEHWRPWKVEVVEVESQAVFLKWSVENLMPFFGKGNTGIYVNGPSIKFKNHMLLLSREQLKKKQLKPSSYFGDNMVIQRGKPIKVWGVGEPHQIVKVELGGNEERAITDENGLWLVTLGSLKKGRGLELKISSLTETVVYNNVDIGEVWLASGQSNMEMRAWQSDVLDSLSKSQDYDLSMLRHYKQQQWSSPVEENETGGKWYVGDSLEVAGWSAVALAFALNLEDKLDVPIAIITAHYGGTGIESWIPQDALNTSVYTRSYMERYKAYDLLLKKGEAIQVPWPQNWDVPGQSHAPGYLFNGMIAPLKNVSMKGVLWYQGESNCHRSSQYQYLLPMLVSTWRNYWQDSAMPFLWVQLAGFDGKVSGNELTDAWPLLRDIQRKVANEVTNTWCISAFDLGDIHDIHPRLKWEVGNRLSAAALRKVYRQTDIVFSGPDLKQVKYKGDKAIVFYKKGTDHLTNEKTFLQGFMVAGNDQKFYPAEARIHGQGVMVSSPLVPHIAAVRYGWENYPYLSKFFNKEGLPALPFRTDNWPIKDIYPY